MKKPINPKTLKVGMDVTFRTTGPGKKTLYENCTVKVLDLSELANGHVKICLADGFTWCCSPDCLYRKVV